MMAISDEYFDSFVLFLYVQCSIAYTLFLTKLLGMLILINLSKVISSVFMKC